jgi:hypothetical protein
MIAWLAQEEDYHMLTNDELQAVLAAQKAKARECIAALADLDEEGRKFARGRLRALFEWLQSYDYELVGLEPELEAAGKAVDACLVTLANLEEPDRSCVWHLDVLFDLEEGIDPAEEGKIDAARIPEWRRELGVAP